VAREATLRGLVAGLNDLVAKLYPGCFAFVMATGIVSHAMLIEGHRGWSDALFAVNLIAYPWLLLLTLLRVVLFCSNFWADFTNPRLVFSFFTLVAATAVFGLGMNSRGHVAIASALWMTALTLWVVLMYFSFGLLIFLKKAQGVKVVHGAWLNAVVGTQSLVLLGAAVAHAFGGLSPTIFMVSHWLWGIGLGLYTIFIALFAYHLFFFDVEPEDLTPLLWIVMGAAAISTNAGSVLISTDSGIPFLDSIRPFVEGVTLLMWAWGTWWIPLLLLLGVWKHGIRGVPLTYSPELWSLVFPLGMYAVATANLSLAVDFPLLRLVSSVMIWVAFAVWAVTAFGLAKATWQHLPRSM